MLAEVSGVSMTIITTKEAAALLNCKPMTVRKALYEGRLKGEKKGRDWLVYVDENLENFSLKKGGRGRRKVTLGQYVEYRYIDLKDYQRRLEEALKLVKKIAPKIPKTVDLTAELNAMRDERDERIKQIYGNSGNSGKSGATEGSH